MPFPGVVVAHLAVRKFHLDRMEGLLVPGCIKVVSAWTQAKIMSTRTCQMRMLFPLAACVCTCSICVAYVISIFV
jgi:hypothetical protein